jgi:4a-hydroxytetrahydrobiopterin dehydratase
MNLNQRHCLPCKASTPPLTEVDENRYFNELNGWEIVRQGTHLIRKEIKFKKYLDEIPFVSMVGALADAEDHHPDIRLLYKKVVVELSTHAVGGLSVNDFILAAKIDALERPAQ